MIAEFFPENFPDIDGEDSHPRTLAFICGFAYFLYARTIVEAGTHTGHGAVSLALCSPQAQVWTCDIREDGRVMQLAEKHGVTDRVHYRVCDFEKLLEEVPGEIDFAYIDASGGSEGSLMRVRHLKAVLPRLRSGGIAVVDDTGFKTWPGADEVREMCDITMPESRGLSILCKP